MTASVTPVQHVGIPGAPPYHWLTEDFRRTGSTPQARKFVVPESITDSQAIERRLTALEQTVARLEERLDETPLACNVQIVDLGDPRYLLACPLTVILESYQDEEVARLPEFDLYASDPSDSIALSKLKAEIIAAYERLEEIGMDHLGPLARQHLLAMRKIIQRIHE